VRDANQRPKQVGSFQISSQIAALLRALYQLIHRSLDQAAGTFIEPRRATVDAIESGRNDVFRCDVIHEQQHPRLQGFDWGHRLGEPAGGRSEFLYLVPINLFDQGVPRWEMAI